MINNKLYFNIFFTIFRLINNNSRKEPTDKLEIQKRQTLRKTLGLVKEQGEYTRRLNQVLYSYVVARKRRLSFCGHIWSLHMHCYIHYYHNPCNFIIINFIFIVKIYGSLIIIISDLIPPMFLELYSIKSMDYWCCILSMYVAPGSFLFYTSTVKSG